MTAKDFLKEIECFNTIYLKRNKATNTMAKIMDLYAENYHQAQLKLLGIANVVGQSEQYTCECKVCGKPFENKEDYYMHYDEEHN